MTRKAQTNIDFLIGMSVFLLTVAFVFGLVPGIFDPFSVDGGSNSLVADRGAARLTEGVLGSPANPAVLNATCTVGFFNTADPDPGECRYEHNATRLEDALAIPDGTHVNVTIVDDNGVRTLDGTTLAAGPDPQGGSTGVVVARRVVSLDGETNKLFVRVW